MMIISILICVYVLRDICSLCCLRAAALLRTLVNYELYFVISYFFIIVLYFIPPTTCRAQIPEPLGPTRCLRSVFFSFVINLNYYFSKNRVWCMQYFFTNYFFISCSFFVVIYLFVDAAKFKIAGVSVTHVHSRFRCASAIQDSILSS